MATDPLTVGAVVAAVGAVMGLGRLQQKVSNNTKEIDEVKGAMATDEKLDVVYNALDGRLERIENKLDRMNGNG